MNDVVKPETVVDEAAQTGKTQNGSLATAPNTRIAPSPNRWNVRAAEIKKQKRRAHRRKINASNTPG